MGGGSPIVVELAEEFPALGFKRMALMTWGGTCTVGTTRTSDAPYRETAAEVLQYQLEGVKTVEMEFAGLFTGGKVRNIQTFSVVVIMDSLAKLHWKVPDRLDGILKSLEIVYLAAIDVLSQPLANQTASALAGISAQS